MNILSNIVKISRCSIKGRSVIASRPIAPGEVIEVAPVISLSKQTREILKTTELFQYCFVEPKTYTLNQSTPGYLILGISTLCNHSAQANASVRWTVDDTGTWATLAALTKIDIDEEVVLAYTDVEEYPILLE